MKAFIKFGKISLKLLYPFMCLVVMFFESYGENNWYAKKRGTVVISLAINSIAKIFDIIIMIPLKIYYHKSSLLEDVQEGNRKKKNRLRNYIIIFVGFFLNEIIFNIFYIIYYVNSRQKSADRKSNGEDKLIYYAHSYGIFFQENIMIIIIFLITKFFLKYEYILQSIISLILFTIFSIVLDTINYGDFIYALGGFGIFMLIFICLLLESIIIVIQKYMMDKLYFSPFLINAIFGFTDGLFTVVLGAISYYKNGWFCYSESPRKCNIDNFMDYFDGISTSEIVGFITSIGFKIIIYILNIYTIYYLNPNHMLLIYILGKFISSRIEETKSDKIVENYIVFCFLFISFIFYLEIFELNFCEINHYTKKNIEDRAFEETKTIKLLVDKYKGNKGNNAINDDDVNDDDFDDDIEDKDTSISKANNNPSSLDLGGGYKY